MDAKTAPHPTDRALRDFGLGKLDGDASEAVGTHLEGCPDCRRVVAGMSSESFLGRLRDARTASSGPRKLDHPASYP